MQNPNLLTYNGNTYNIDDVIRGQSEIAMYDPLKQIAYQPFIRRNQQGNIAAVLPYAQSGIWGLFSQLQAHLGSDKKVVNSRRYFYAEYEAFGTYAFAVNRSLAAVPAGGTAVTVKINRFSLSQNGLFAKPLRGFKGYIKENGQQNVVITNVTELASGDFNITFSPINGEVLDLTRRTTYTVVMNMLRSYDITATNKIQTQGVVGEYPGLYESWVQKYENGLEVDESEIDNYIYMNGFTIAKGLDMYGKEINYWYSPSLHSKAEEFIIQNRSMKTIFNQKDYGRDEEFDALVPVIKKRGNFNFAYDNFVGASFKSLLFAMIKSIRKINGSNEYMLLHDFNFGIDWSNAIASLISANNQQYRFSLFGDGGRGMQENFEWYQFKDFGWSNYQFRTYMIDLFDDRRFGRPLEYTAFLIPAKSSVDVDGNMVPPVSYVSIAGAEPAKEQKVWTDDTRLRGGRTLVVYIKDNFSTEFHKASQMGMISKGL